MDGLPLPRESHRLPCGFVWSAAPADCRPTSPVKTEADRLAARRARGLPTQASVNACFNRAHKLDPHTFDLWPGVLWQAPASALWLSQESLLLQQRLHSCAAAVGLNPERIVFSSKVDSVDFEDLCALADLHLHTTHYGSSQALMFSLEVLLLGWAALPIVGLPVGLLC